MYTVASPDPNLRGGGQLTNPNECNSKQTSGTRGIYPYLYIDEESVPCAKFKWKEQYLLMSIMGKLKPNFIFTQR